MNSPENKIFRLEEELTHKEMRVDVQELDRIEAVR